jgi:hypothetical protein
VVPRRNVYVTMVLNSNHDAKVVKIMEPASANTYETKQSKLVK